MMSWLSKTIERISLGRKGVVMADEKQKEMPGQTVAQVKLPISDTADFGVTNAYSRSKTIGKGFKATTAGAIIAGVVLSAVRSMRANGNPLIVWDETQDDTVIVGFVAFLFGAWAMVKNLWNQRNNLFRASVVLLCVFLSGCTTTLGTGGLSFSTTADAANAVAPTVLSVSRSIAEIMGKLAAEKDLREQETLAIKLQAQQQRLQTIMQFIDKANGPKE